MRLMYKQCGAVALLWCMPWVCMAHSPVEKTMERMQTAYKGALRSKTIAQMQPYVTQLHTYADQASQLQYGKTAAMQADYKDGMRELQTDLQDVDDALAQHDLATAQRILKQQVAATKKQAHQTLRVEEEHEKHEHEADEHETHEREKHEHQH